MANTSAQTEQQIASLEKRSIVSSFLFKYPDIHSRAAEVALFHRSDKVRTYQHYLAPISGSIDRHTDASPLDAAWRELKEETSLTPDSAKLWRKGRPFTFQDYSVGREWTIYPFAFLLKLQTRTRRHTVDEECIAGDGETDGVVLDWEHSFHNWYDPDEVLSRLLEDGEEARVSGQKLVPRIADSLIQVYPEYELGPVAGRRLREGLQQLQDDHESGARELTTIALNIFRDVLNDVRPSDSDAVGTNWEEWWRKARLTAWHIWMNGRESMGAAIASALLTALAELEPLYRDLQPDGENVDRLIDALIEKRRAMTTALSQAFTVYVDDELWEYRDKTTLKIVSLSASSTIRESILQLLSALAEGRIHTVVAGGRIRTVELRVLESRPLFEGVSLASAIVSSYEKSRKDREHEVQLHVTIYTDASAALACTGVDMLLLGADRIAKDGAVSNKTGSLPAILAAKHVAPRSKVVVLSELDKVADPDYHPAVENSDVEEVMAAWRKTVREEALGVVEAGGGNVPGRGRVEVKNVYFEWVPPELIDAYITEEGIQGEENIRQRSQWIDKQIHRFFDDLTEASQSSMSCKY
ncbi:hypothetical protein BGW36DRAFT_422813 [Talaromyces proteolyticus]|uniref:Nudix hydrolase domain-containing protein n=1 Tax=Talaromyces proteolyticus TaxID=1131652 RepID=A0AAD4KZ13_9EURO|nr:uncharacterized protein BGW36DRAFT_422813 [Talaromyces proteolyticus]KAH8703244.1 hypothetical protein BGW36DRAFT_422813 [Talaromyces proteolyticus]